MPVKSDDRAVDGPSMNAVLDPVHAALIVVAIAAWMVLMCLRVIGHAIERAAERHNLMLECRRLRRLQIERLQELRARQQAPRRSGSKPRTQPLAPQPVEGEVDIIEEPSAPLEAVEVLEPVEAVQAA
jgi:hypothetical protein